jgi:hypothetical protein
MIGSRRDERQQKDENDDPQTESVVMAHASSRASRYRAHRWLWVLLLFGCLHGVADSSLRLEQLKAAYVFNFLKFTIWPAEGTQNLPLSVCLGNSNASLQRAFASLQGQQVNGRKIYIRALPLNAEVAGCHVYYLRQGGAPVALRTLVQRDPGLLTIGDGENFIADGGIIGLQEVDGRLQFDINLKLIRKGDYQISSQLLKLARNAGMKQ